MVEPDEGSESSTCTEHSASSSSDGSSSTYSDSDSSISSTAEEDDDKSQPSSPPPTTAPVHAPQSQQIFRDDDEYAAQVRLWTDRVPIGLGLCPWAIKSKRQGHLRYRTCKGNMPSDVALRILSEAKALCFNASDGDGVAPWSTSLIVCPRITAWNNDFQVFDEFVRTFPKEQQLLTKEEDLLFLQQNVTLVPFHPKFLRWRGLPKDIQIGSVVQSHKPIGGFQKSQQTFPATVLETSNKVFGRRKIKVQFHDNDDDDDDDDEELSLKKKQQCYVPIDWLLAPEQQSVEDEEHGDVRLGPPLPDNVMHRAPYPTVHLIRNEDLATLCCRDVSRVKRINAQQMMKLGWDGLHKKIATNATK